MASGTWTNTAGTNIWPDNGNWSASPYPGSGAGETATLDLVAGGNISLNGITLTTLTALNTSGGAWFINPSSTETFFPATATINSATTLAAPLATGTSTFTKAGTATLTLTGGAPSTATGAWAINAGTLAVTTAAIAAASGTITVTNATLTSASGIAISKPISIGAGGTATLDGAIGTISVVGAGAAATANAAVTSFTVNGGGTLTLNGAGSTATTAFANTAGNAVLNVGASRTISSLPTNIAAASTATYSAINQTGAGSTVATTGAVTFGTNAASLAGYGYYKATAGTFTPASTVLFNSGMLDFNGGTFSGASRQLYLGQASGTGSSSAIVSGHAFFNTGIHILSGVYLGQAGTGTVGDRFGRSILSINNATVSAASTTTNLNTDSSTTAGGATVHTINICNGGVYQTVSGVTTVAGRLVSTGQGLKYISLVNGGTLNLGGGSTSPTVPAITLYGTGNKIGGGTSAAAAPFPFVIQQATGNGITSVSFTGGTQYVGPPMLSVASGGAVLKATINASGNVDSCTVECPGDGYGSAPAISLLSGTSGTAASFTATIGPNSTDGAIEKIGAYTLYLTGTNTNTGTYTVTTGTLRVGNVSAVGTLGSGDSSALDVKSGATFEFARNDARTYSGKFSGAGTITILGGAKVTVTSTTSDHTGFISLALANSILALTTNASLGATSANSVTQNVTGTAIELSGGITVADRPMSLIGTGVSSAGAINNVSGNNTLPGAISLAGATRINSTSGTLALTSASAITGGASGLTLGGAGNISISSSINTTTGTLTKDGAGTASLLATTSTFSGAVTVSAGTLEVAAVANAGSASSLGNGTAISLANGTTLKYSGSSNTSTTRVLTLPTALTDSVYLNASGSGSVTYAGNPSITGGAGVTKTLALTGTSTASNEFSGLIANPATGTTAIAKGSVAGDTGIWGLSNTSNSYTGGTTVNYGTLRLIVPSWTASAKVTGTGAVTVGAGGRIQTLAGSGANAQLGRHTYPAGLTFAANSRIRIGG